MEIILMDDYSFDTSLNLIKEMQNEDQRIKVIKNKKNMGILYTRCMGALAAKGKYIFTIDMDDLFFDYDIVNTIYNIAEKGNYDIVAFSAVDIKDYMSDIYNMTVNRFHDKTNNLIVKQPELGVYPISDMKGNYFLNDPHIWGKCIKTEIYKKAVNDLGEERYSFFNRWNEDQIILFVICNLSQTYIFIRKFGIFHFVHKESSTAKLSYVKKRFEEIFLLNIIFEFSRGDNKKFAVYKAIQFREWMGKILSRRYIVKVEPILAKIMKCEEIELKYKERLIKSYKGRINLKKYLNLNDTIKKPLNTI
jgi:glycosyltransferase involved in cell wall biosynthesis